MPELDFERVFGLRNYPAMDVIVRVTSTGGTVMGRAQTGGRMQVVMTAPKATMITAGVYAPFGAPKPELPKYVAKIITDVSKSIGPATSFVSKFSVSCTLENVNVTQEQAIRIFESIGEKLEQQVERVEIVPARMVFR